MNLSKKSKMLTVLNNLVKKMKNVIIFALTSMFFLFVFKTNSVNAESNYTGDVLQLFWITAAGSVFVGAIVFGLLFYFIWKYRETTNTPRNRVKNETKYEKIWIAFAIILVVILVGISTPILLQVQNPPDTQNAVELKVNAYQFNWKINVTETNTSYNTQFNKSIELKINTMYKLNLTSDDVVHSFFVYDLTFKIDAVPGQFNIKYFKILNAGDYIVTCAEYCGVNHYHMQFTIHAI